MPAANGRIGNNRSIHHALEDKKDDGDIRNEQGQFSGPIVLVKKDVDEIVFLRFFTEENDIIKNILLNNGTLLIYTSKKKIYDNQYMLDFAEYIDLCEELTDELALRLIEKLRKFIGASEHSEEKHSWFIDMMKKGIAIHHGSMPLNARLIMEDFVRLGYAKICFSTATLLQGINMPFDVVWIDNFINMTPLNLKNLIGRAGRTTSHKKEFEYGIVVINKKNISTFSERIRDNYEIKYTSMLDEDVSNLDDDLKDIAEAIKNNNFDDELKLTHSQVERLKSDDIMADILYILDNLLDSNNLNIESNPIFFTYASNLDANVDFFDENSAHQNVTEYVGEIFLNGIE